MKEHNELKNKSKATSDFYRQEKVKELKLSVNYSNQAKKLRFVDIDVKAIVAEVDKVAGGLVTDGV